MMKTKKQIAYAYTTLCACFLVGTVCSCDKAADDAPDNTIELTQGQAVDLGLSVKWASCNIGASSPEEYGGYYAWGETTEKASYTEKNYQFYNPHTCNFDSIGDISGTQYDVARIKLGDAWRMPTFQEVQELCLKCTWKLATYKDIQGLLVIGPNGNTIFLPATGACYSEVYNQGELGYYWAGTQYSNTDNGYLAYYMNIGGSNHPSWANGGRHVGYSVRPVSESRGEIR